MLCKVIQIKQQIAATLPQSHSNLAYFNPTYPSQSYAETNRFRRIPGGGDPLGSQSFDQWFRSQRFHGNRCTEQISLWWHGRRTRWLRGHWNQSGLILQLFYLYISVAFSNSLFLSFFSLSLSVSLSVSLAIYLPVYETFFLSLYIDFNNVYFIH